MSADPQEQPDHQTEVQGSASIRENERPAVARQRGDRHSYACLQGAARVQAFEPKQDPAEICKLQATDRIGLCSERYPKSGAYSGRRT